VGGYAGGRFLEYPCRLICGKGGSRKGMVTCAWWGGNIEKLIRQNTYY